MSAFPWLCSGLLGTLIFNNLSFLTDTLLLLPLTASLGQTILLDVMLKLLESYLG